MAVTRLTLRLAQQLRVVIDGILDRTVRELVEAWARAWQVIDAEWVAAMDELVEMSTDGQWPTAAQVFRATAAQAALASATREILDLSEFTGVTVVAAAREVTEEVAVWQSRLIASQLPRTAAVGAMLRPMPDQVLAAIVERTTEQIESRRQPLSVDAAEAMKQALVRGIVVGENPRVTARRMVDRAEHRFNGGLTRAMSIARTEVMDAHRSATAAYQLEQTDVLRGWAWHAKLDTRTCPSCWAKHGTEHELTETGPDDHPQGRCARTPLTKSWAELGIDLDEPDSLLPDARASFDALPRGDKLRVLGPVRLKALEDGAIGWEDLSVLRTSDGWRDSWVPVPVQDARRSLVSVAR
ncbi:phage minor head protein [Nocardioides lijunqiniae]|uniref:phage minor head protein n=1 Tax=Nocardioides lijunqiniae TaxID=2760832 RepID=UPI0018786635|nr:phage minor head protein [Nocardioides lijunqiniae]